MEQSLDITEVRKQLARVVDAAEYQGENCVIVRHGQPAAAVVPIELYLRWKREREQMFQAIRDIQEANADADAEQVFRDVLEAQQAIRRSTTE